jgi:hypothetical protein
MAEISELLGGEAGGVKEEEDERHVNEGEMVGVVGSLGCGLS